MDGQTPGLSFHLCSDSYSNLGSFRLDLTRSSLESHRERSNDEIGFGGDSVKGGLFRLTTVEILIESIQTKESEINSKYN